MSLHKMRSHSDPICLKNTSLHNLYRTRGRPRQLQRRHLTSNSVTRRLSEGPKTRKMPRKIPFRSPSSADFLFFYGRHTGETPYQCRVCRKKFKHSSSLKPHLRIHTGEKPYACDLCGKKFSRADHLKNHLLAHANKNKSKNSQSHDFSNQKLLEVFYGH